MRRDTGHPPPVIDTPLAAEIALLAEAFRALRRDRGQAWNAACDVAYTQGKRRPSLRPYGIDDIKRLARRFGMTATHWSE